MWITSSLDTVLTPTAVALGNFDGIHRGHQKVVQPILDSRFNLISSQQRSEILCPLAEGLSQDSLSRVSQGSALPCLSPYLPTQGNEHSFATVVTFHPHPQEFFTGQRKQLLTPLDEKVEWLQRLGVEQLVLLPFDQHLAELSPVEFVEEILVKGLHARRVSVGFDFHFGKNRAGNVKDLEEIAGQFGIEVASVPLYPCEYGERISSSMIRQSLQQGDIKRANHLLGRSYQLVGTVVQGQQLGRTIGFPTANLQLPPEKFLPRYGVYAVRVYPKLDSQPTSSSSESGLTTCLNGVMNIGCRPTVEGQYPTVEIHILDWSGDLYGQTLKVTLEEFLRPEQKFPSLDALKGQISTDCVAAKRILNSLITS